RDMSPLCCLVGRQGRSFQDRTSTGRSFQRRTSTGCLLCRQRTVVTFNLVAAVGPPPRHPCCHVSSISLSQFGRARGEPSMTYGSERADFMRQEVRRVVARPP